MPRLPWVQGLVRTVRYSKAIGVKKSISKAGAKSQDADLAPVCDLSGERR